jgi:signal transduction histidine kinase
MLVGSQPPSPSVVLECVPPNLPNTENPNALEPFFQLQVNQLATRSPLYHARLIYDDPRSKTRQTITSITSTVLSVETLAYLKSEVWLLDFPLVLTLTEIHFEQIAAKGYLCPLGYRHAKPEYLLVLSQENLSVSQQAELLHSASTLLQYQTLYLNYCDRTTEIQLLEQVIHRIGHQLRNPLGLIALYAESLYLELSSDRLQTQAASIRETVQETLKHLTELIYCGQSQLNSMPYDLRSLVEESLQALQPLFQLKHLQVNYPDTSVELRMDRFQMKQVFDNLLRNAIDYSPESGAIGIHWQVFQGEVLIQITDQGTGIATDELQKIFQPFYSRRPGGTGLGLTIAKKIILDHQGNLWAQNAPEGGTQFSITLPTRLSPCLR